MAKKQNAPEIRFEGFTDPWEQRKFSDMYVVNNERNANCELGYDRTLSIATMTFNGGNGAADDSLSNYKVIRVGDIAFEGHTNKVHAYGRFVLNDAGDGLMSPRFSCLRPIVEQRYSFWKYYIPREESMRPILVNATKSGTMMNELVPDDLMRESILVPCLAEQEVIGNSLSQLDHLITLHQRKYDKLCTVKKSMLDKMFPKPGETEPEIRFEGFTDPWEQRKLGELCEVKDSARVPNSLWNESGIPYIRASDLSNNDMRGVLFLSPGTFDFYSALTGNPIKGDVLFNGGGEIGKAHLLTEKSQVYVQGGAVLYARTSESENLDGQFLEAAFESAEVRSYIEVAAAGGTMKHFTLGPAKMLPLSIPHMPEQQSIGSLFALLDNLITLHQRKLELLRNIKKSLLDRMFV